MGNVFFLLITYYFLLITFEYRFSQKYLSSQIEKDGSIYGQRMQEEQTVSLPCRPFGLKKQGDSRLPSGSKVSVVWRARQRG